MTENNTHICNICNKKYVSSRSLWNHNNKYHNKLNEDNTYQCKYCNKILSRKDSLFRHETICKETVSEINQLKEEIKSLKKDILKTNPNIIKNNTNNTNNSNTNNITNNTQINNIVINHPGMENVYLLNDTEINEIFQENIKSIIVLIELLNFNKRLPSNHNFCTKNLQSLYLDAYNIENDKFDKYRKRYFYTDIINKAYNKLKFLFEHHKNKLKPARRAEISDTLETLYKIITTDYNKKLLKELICAVNLLSYNNREMIQKTWVHKYNDIEDDDTLTFNEDLDKIDLIKN